MLTSAPPNDMSFIQKKLTSSTVNDMLFNSNDISTNNMSLEPTIATTNDMSFDTKDNHL